MHQWVEVVHQWVAVLELRRALLLVVGVAASPQQEVPLLDPGVAPSVDEKGPTLAEACKKTRHKIYGQIR